MFVTSPLFPDVSRNLKGDLTERDSTTIQRINFFERNSKDVGLVDRDQKLHNESTNEEIPPYINPSTILNVLPNRNHAKTRQSKVPFKTSEDLRKTSPFTRDQSAADSVT
jgi:hypothetical protein